MARAGSLVDYVYIGYGEGGIRTPGRSFSPYNGLANRRIQPLCHLSAGGSTEANRPNGLSITLNRTPKWGQFFAKSDRFRLTIWPFFASNRAGQLSPRVPLWRDGNSFLSGVLNIE